MQKKCETCGRILNIPDEKIPEGKVVVATCPSCRDKIRILKEKKVEADFDFEEGTSDIPDFPEAEKNEEKSSYTPVESSLESDNEELFSMGSFEEHDPDEAGDPFDFIEEEGDMAMVCVEDEDIKKKIGKVLDYMEYTVLYPGNTHEALKDLRMKGEFALVVVDELFSAEGIESNAVVRFFKRLPMRDRRDVFVALLSDSRRTLDRRDAFAHSVNMIINKSHVPRFEDFIKKGLTNSENFNKNFKETLKKGLNF